jgi:hypothetical protein
LNQDNEELLEINGSEKEKHAKLIAIAADKYNMDLTRIDNYMPRGPAF